MTKEREALKLALEALEGLFGIPDYWTSEGGGGVAVWRMGGSDAPRQAIAAIKEALAQPEQDPVAWTLLLVGADNGLVGKAGAKFVGHPEHYERVDVYTTPPKRSWVGLTDEQKYKLIKDHLGLEQRRDDTVIDRRTGRFTDAARYFALIDAAFEIAHGIKENT